MRFPLWVCREWNPDKAETCWPHDFSEENCVEVGDYAATQKLRVASPRIFSVRTAGLASRFVLSRAARQLAALCFAADAAKNCHRMAVTYRMGVQTPAAE